MKGMEKRPTEHSMKRRSAAHDYSRSGIYHVTMSVARALRQPLGRMAGQLDKPDGDSDAPHVELSAVGRMVEEELLTSICRYYPMLEVQDYVIMPEHLHFLLVAHSNVVSQHGKSTHLGHVIAGFKQGCNRRYWAMIEGAGGEDQATGREDQATESPDTIRKDSVCGDFVAASLAASPDPRSRGLQPLFDAGYCDVMPVDAEQLATQRAYIRANPRNRLLRMSHRVWLQPQRATVDAAVTLSALRGYLQRECGRLLTEEAWLGIERRLLVSGGHVLCDSYGDVALLRGMRQATGGEAQATKSPDTLRGSLLPVVCHRKDAALFERQKVRCLEAAAAGAVLVSARIAQGEQDIMDTALLSGFPVVRIEPNGFPDIYHPSADRTDDCAAGHLLLLTPWCYEYVAKDEGVSVPFCKTMNCVAQAICRTKDDWWKSE